MGKFRPGQSGNPAGKKPGTKNRKTILLEALSKDNDALAAAIKAAALAGDVGAQNLWASRIEAPARARGQYVEFGFDPNATPADNIAKVLSAIDSGELTLEQGNILISGLEKLASARAALQGKDTEAELIAAFKDMASKLPV